MEEVDTTEDSRQMLVFTHLLNLSVAEEAISNSFPKISSTPKILPAQNPPPLSFFPIKSHTAFLFLPPRELPTLTAAAARAEQHQSSPIAFQRCQGP